MNRLSSLIYHAVHKNGFAADAVYSVARPMKRAWNEFNGWRASRNRVEPEEARKFGDVAKGGYLVIGITNICNAKCVFCAYPRAVESKNLQGGVMSLEIFKKVVDEWAALGGEHIDLTHTVGEPLVDPGIAEKIDYAKNQAGIKLVTMTTNGILLNRRDTYKRLVDLAVTEIAISTSGTDKEIYEKVYGVNHYEDMLSGVHNLLQYNQSKGEPTRVVIRFRNAQKPSEIIRDRDFIEHIKPFLSRQVRHNFTVDFDNWGGLIKDEDMTGVMHLRKPLSRTDVPCVALFGYLVRYDGSVRLCGCRFKKSDMDDMIVGNIRQQTLLEISRSDKAWNIIKGFYSGTRPETCYGCTLYQPITRGWLRERVMRSVKNEEQAKAAQVAEHKESHECESCGCHAHSGK
jgi:MoaA/NifB/PqqE/SkfB family radical SAM enzyme